MTPRGRHPARISGDERQDAILSAAELLLAERALDDISIEEFARGAGISRSNFYFYFASRDEMLLTLLDRVIAEVEARVAALPRDFDHEPAAAWRLSIGDFVEVFAEHRAVATAAITARRRSPEVLALWSAAMRTWVDYSTEIILAERRRGAAPDGIAAVDLAVSLTLLNERVLSASFSGETLAVDQAAVLDVLSTIWVRSIYGAAADR